MSSTSHARQQVRKPERHDNIARGSTRTRKRGKAAALSFHANADFVREIVEETILPELWSAADALASRNFSVEVKVAGAAEPVAEYHSQTIAWAEIHVRALESDATFVLRFAGEASADSWQIRPRLGHSSGRGGPCSYLAAAWEMLVLFIRERLSRFFKAEDIIPA